MNKNLLTEDQRKTISERIKLLRTEDGLSQENLAEILGVKQQTIAAWENAERAIKLNTLYDLAGVFNVSADFILGLSDTRKNEEREGGSVYGLNHKTETKLKSFARTGGRKVPNKYLQNNAISNTRWLIKKLLERDDIEAEGNEALRAELTAFLASTREETYEGETMPDVLNDVIDSILDSELIAQLYMCRHCVREIQASMKNNNNSIAEKLIQMKYSHRYYNHLDRCKDALERVVDSCSNRREHRRLTRI